MGVVVVVGGGGDKGNRRGRDPEDVNISLTRVFL